jgi:glutathione S-transferase
LNSEKFLFSNNISLSDIALLPFVRQFSNVDIIWFRNRFINLSGWMDELIGMEIFQAMMKKFEIWNPFGKGEEVIFNN